SIWELAIKVSIGKIDLGQPIESFVVDQIQGNGIDIFNINIGHVVLVSQLPFHHRDPFDRLIIAQAMADKLPVVSADSTFDHYSIARLW
ncbi:MAG TPA: type II toxin-antitoxin system VapC family toxin, partial [Armatimonadota bacterium]